MIGWIESFILAGKAASKNNVPVLLDPVGAGATRLRTETTLRILNEVEVSCFEGEWWRDDGAGWSRRYG